MDMDAMACTTGKSTRNYGVSGRTESNGLGIYYLLREICNNDSTLYKHVRKDARLLKGLEKKKVVIQGMGNVGYWTAKILHEHKAIITGIVVDFCSLTNSKGINPTEALNAMTHYKETGKDTQLKALGELSFDDRALYLKCDILIPAAMEMAIHTDNVDKINAKMIVEAANGAISKRADEILSERGVVTIPDVLAGTGGLISSYFEYLSNIDKRKQSDLVTKWEEQSKRSMLMLIDGVFEKAKLDIPFIEELKDGYMKGPTERDLHNGTVENIILESLERILETSDKEKVNLRTACYNVAIRRIENQYLGLVV